ncbi:PREDICTED: uncharacterized protein LOC109147857 [Ipomoea nil]|uniref:uncharacterized protein LOC109147857 n=1 Tax=Ipomoea nil TaxID=35883 RepID=UPI000901EFDD|nr:PREDICTED: uncharacterized protein LOC109147857 [Ipomoea nil]
MDSPAASDGVLFLGIWGINSNTTTTLMRRVSNMFSDHFENVCLIQVKSLRKRGMVSLQKQLLEKVSMNRNLNVVNVVRGMSMIIKQRLCLKRVLVILEGVDTLHQLRALVGSRDWFGSGRDVVGPFSVFLFHNGVINRVGEVKYMGSDVEVYDRMEAREICFQVLKDMIKNLGYCEVGTLIYCLSNGGLKLLQSDMDVIKILNEENPGNMLEFWVETMDEVDLIDVEMEVEEQVAEQQKVAEHQKATNLAQEARTVDDACVEIRKKKCKTNDEVEIKFSDEESIVDSDSDVEGKWPIFRAATDMKDP